VEFFRKLFAPREVPSLRSIPKVRRQKNYSAESGYAYEYFFEGLRDAGGVREYVFTVSGDRKTWFPLSVYVPDDEVQALSESERYAVAKMALFGAFDERASPAAMREPVRVAAGQVEALLERLGLS
jgi:hypothetical protein